MQVVAKKIFLKDVETFDLSTRQKIRSLVLQLQDFSFEEMQQKCDIKKLSGYADYRRIRIGKVRIGLKYEGGVLVCMRCKLRKDIYRYFP